MVGFIDQLEVETWLYARLNGDATLKGLLGTGERIFREVAPVGAALPYVVYQHRSHSDVRGVASQRIMGNLTYMVKVIAQTADALSVKAAAVRVDVLLQGASGTTAGGRVIGCIREQSVTYEETADSGVRFQHLGGIYRIYATPLNGYP